MIRTHRFNGIRFTVDFEPQHGSCTNTEGPHHEIAIYGGLQENKRTLELLIHEALHAIDWDKTEDTVTIAAREISGFLWRIGYRLKGAE